MSDDWRPMSELLEELRETCCKFMGLAFKLKCKEDDEARRKRKECEHPQPQCLEPFVNPWTKSPTE